MFPKPLVTAEQCILYCVFTLISDQEGRKQMVEIVFLKLVCAVSADEPSNYKNNSAENYFYLEMCLY